MKKAARPWGYKIDYSASIAQDLLDIAMVERHRPLSAVLSDTERSMGPFHLSLPHFLVADVARRAPLLGLSIEQATELAWYWDLGLPDSPEPTAGWYRRAADQEKRLATEFGDYVLRDTDTSKLRDRLARHRRNQKVYG
jgi:hypothetical protein